MNVKVDKTLVASIALHVLVIGWGLVTFSTKAYVSMQESVAVDVVSLSTLTKAGTETGKNGNPKPIADKIAEAKPAQDVVGKIEDKKPPVISDVAPKPEPKVEDKPVEKKPDPPKPVAEQKPKQEAKPDEKKPEPQKVDPIAEALKKEEKKTPPKPAVAAPKPPEQTKIKERHFDQTQIAQLLDKRDPTRQSMTGETLNSNAALGTTRGKAAANSAMWKDAFSRAVARCFSFPYNGQDADQYEVDIDIPMRKDGMVAGEPVIVAVRGPSKSVANAMGDSAKRAVLQCQAYAFLPKDQYDDWKMIPGVFGLTQLLALSGTR